MAMEIRGVTPKMGFEREHWNGFSQYNRHFCRTKKKKIVQDIVGGLGNRACTKIVTIRLFNAQGNASRIIPRFNVFLLQNEHAMYKMQGKVPPFFFN